MSSPASARSKFSFHSSNTIRVVGVTVARPRAYDVQQSLVLAGFCVLAGILMSPSIVCLLSLTGYL
jgi:hypothetical protein